MQKKKLCSGVSLIQFLILLFFTSTLKAEYQFGFGSGSYLGRAQVHATLITKDNKNEVSAVLGYTQDPAISSIKQISAIYLRSILDPVSVEGSDFFYHPLLLGAVVTYTDNPNFYVDSPEIYPQDRYYDVTSLRWGLRASTQIKSLKVFDQYLHFSLDGTLLERAFIVYFNNPDELDLFKYFFSLGFTVKTSF